MHVHVHIPANLRRSKIWRFYFALHPPTPTPECQQHQHPQTSPPHQQIALGHLYDILNDVHEIKMRFHHCNDELIVVID